MLYSHTIKLVRYYQGVDGLKTGYTSNSGYCITTTAKRDNLRFITVVMGEPTSVIRNNETVAMLDYGFNTYEVNTLVKKDKVLKRKKVLLGEKDYINIVPKEEINILNSKNENKRNVTYKVEVKEIKAPIKKGDIVGKIKVIENNKIIMEIDATVDKNIKKSNIFKVYYKSLLDIIKGTI